MTLAVSFFLLLLVSFLTAIGQICFKKAALKNIPFFRKFFHPTFLIGCILFICCPVLSSLAATVVDFSVLYAMTALNFVFILLFSWLLLKEKIDSPKMIGVCFIVFGLIAMVIK